MYSYLGLWFQIWPLNFDRTIFSSSYKKVKNDYSYGLYTLEKGSGVSKLKFHSYSVSGSKTSIEAFSI